MRNLRMDFVIRSSSFLLGLGLGLLTLYNEMALPSFPPASLTPSIR